MIDASSSSCRVVLGISGGIAAYKSAELTRLLVKQGIVVDVVMTEAGERFVTPTTFQALSGRPVYDSLWHTGADNAMGHISLSRDASLILVAPATANFIAKLAHGVADDLLSTLCLARECPLYIAPAMNVQMWQNAATQRNLAQVRQDGVMILGPGSGELACQEYGDGRMLEPEELLAVVDQLRQPKLLRDKKVLITAGPTFEAIDPVRGITNLSSGKMGFALALAMAEAGATVSLIAGPTGLSTPPGVQRTDVKSASEMAAEVSKRLGAVDIFLAVAAVADYTVANPSARKHKKSGEPLTLTLVPTQDILATVAARQDPPFCVGFAAESENVEEQAAAKRLRKGIPLIIANRAQDALGSDTNEVSLIDADGTHRLPRMDKLSLARRLVREIAERLPARHG